MAKDEARAYPHSDISSSVTNMQRIAERAYRQGIITKSDLARLHGGSSWPTFRDSEQASEELGRLLGKLSEMLESAKESLRAEYGGMLPPDALRRAPHPAVRTPETTDTPQLSPAGLTKAKPLLSPAGMVVAAGVTIAILAPAPRLADDTLSGAIRRIGPEMKRWAVKTLTATTLDTESNRMKIEQAISWLRALADSKLYPKGSRPLVTQKELERFEAIAQHPRFADEDNQLRENTSLGGR